MKSTANPQPNHAGRVGTEPHRSFNGTEPTMTDPLAAHRAVIAAAGPEALMGIVRPLTPAEEQTVDDYLNRTYPVGSVNAQAQAFLIARSAL